MIQLKSLKDLSGCSVENELEGHKVGKRSFVYTPGERY